MRRPIDTSSPRARAVLDRVRSIAPGRVTTYADLSPEAPRRDGAVYGEQYSGADGHRIADALRDDPDAAAELAAELRVT